MIIAMPSVISADDADKARAFVRDVNGFRHVDTAPVNDEGWGWMTMFKIPGGGEIGMYQPKHPTPLQAKK